MSQPNYESDQYNLFELPVPEPSAAMTPEEVAAFARFIGEHAAERPFEERTNPVREDLGYRDDVPVVMSMVRSAPRRHDRRRASPRQGMDPEAAREASSKDNARIYSLSGAPTEDERALAAEALKSEAFAEYQRQRKILSVQRALRHAGNDSGRSLALLEASNKPNKQ